MCKGLVREEVGGGALLREPVGGVGSMDKDLIISFTGRPTTLQGGAAHRGWQATRALCRNKYQQNKTM